MAKLDLFLDNLVRFGATGLRLSSGSNVCLRFPTGDRFAKQVTHHDDLILLVQEIAPPEAAADINNGGASFPYDYEDKAYEISVEGAGEALTVTVDPRPSGPVKTATIPVSEPPEGTGHRAGPVETPVAPETPATAVTPPSPQIPSTGSASGINDLLRLMKDRGASDLHLSTGHAPYIRLHGEMVPLSEQLPWTEQHLLGQIMEIAPERNRREFEERNDTDFAHQIPNVSRFRVNVFRDRKGPGAVLRAIPYTILTPEQLGLPKKVLELCSLTKGLVLVTGPTGSGKSTTLATLIDHINSTRKDHIITIEDPIEFVHESRTCLVNQREVSVHTSSFKNALRAALREDPDIVLVGEMRDLETIAIAVETAETGHLVFGTLHTTTAPSTVDRIIDQFPADRQDQIRQMVSESLRGVIAQTLCRKADGKGRAAAYEILFGSSAVSNLIRERKTFQLYSLMQTGRGQGMLTLNDSLLELVKKKVVDPLEAYMKSVNKVEFMSLLKRENIKLTFPEA